MAGASCGLFVAAHVGSSVEWLTSQLFLVIMMIVGAIGFYLGIDIPPIKFDTHEPDPKVDSAELFSAEGTFLATMTAFVSVGIIVLRENPRIFWTTMIMLGWVVGVTMQIIAGAIARTRT
jgi:hypothetical protein